MKMEDLLICYEDKYFAPCNVPGDGNCFFSSAAKSPFIPITGQKELRKELCTGLSIILKCPLSEECKILTSYYNDTDNSNLYSIESYLKRQMSRDRNWGTSFEMVLTALV